MLLQGIQRRVVGYSLALPITSSLFGSVGLSELLDKDMRADVRDLTKLAKVLREQSRRSSFTLLRNRWCWKRSARPRRKM